MKTLKSLLMLCAGLSFCACSSDNEPQLPEGAAAITIKIAPPTSRTIDTTPYGGVEGEDKVTVEGTIYVKLTADTGGGVKPVDANNTVTFYGITNPTKVEAYVNGGKFVNDNFTTIQIDSKKTDDSDSSDGIDNYDLQADAESVPAYGSVAISSSNLTTSTEYYGGVNYRMYAVTVPMSIPIARVEFAVSRESESTLFSSLNLAGVYLDYIKPTSGVEAVNYYHKNDKDLTDGESNVTYKTTATGDAAALLYDYETVGTIPFIAKDAVLPAASQVYAYNIFPGSVPHIKLWFNQAAAKNSGDYVVPYQYAVVNSYNSGALTEFQAGKIYRITGLTLTDNNLSTNESGVDADVVYGIDVTVEEAKWDVVDVTGSWTKP